MDLNNQIIIYQTEDGQIQIDVRLEKETVWLTQAQMVELFQTTKQNISLHVGNVFKEGELEQKSTVKEYLTVQKKNIYNVEELERKSTCAKIAHVPFWNTWVMKGRVDSEVVAKFANTTQYGAKVVVNLINKNNYG